MDGENNGEPNPMKKWMIWGFSLIFGGPPTSLKGPSSKYIILVYRSSFLLETHIFAPESLDGWNTIRLPIGAGPGIFSGAFAVSFREGIDECFWLKPEIPWGNLWENYSDLHEMVK